MRNRTKRQAAYFAKQAHRKRMNKIRQRLPELVMMNKAVVRAVEVTTAVVRDFNAAAKIINSLVTTYSKTA